MSGIKQPVLKYDFSKLKPPIGTAAGTAGTAGTAKIEDLIGDNDLDICSNTGCSLLTSANAISLPLPLTLGSSSKNYKNDSINNINLTEEFTIYMELDLDLASSNIGFFNIDNYLRLIYIKNTITFVNGGGGGEGASQIITFNVNTSATYKTLILTGKNDEKPKLYLDGNKYEGNNVCKLSTKSIKKLEIGKYSGGSPTIPYYFTGKIYSFELYDYDISTDSKFDQWLLINTAKNKSIKDLNLEDLYVLNELNKEYERQMDTKQNIAKKEENYYKYKKGNEDLVFRIGFYRNYGNILKKTTIVVHFVLIAIILIIMVYRLA